MKVTVPQSTQPVTRIVAKTDSMTISVTCDRSIKEVDISLPEGVTEDDVLSVTAQFLDNGNHVQGEHVIRDVKPVEPEPQPIMAPPSFAETPEVPESPEPETKPNAKPYSQRFEAGYRKRSEK